MSTTYDAIVLGIGGFGAAALDHLARRGVSVLGIERFEVPHERGSSHGRTRIIRKAYFEHPDYVPLLTRAYEQWEQLQTDAGRSLWDLCGLLLAGRAKGGVISGVRLAARTHGIPIENIPLAEARRRFGGFRFSDEFDVVFEPEAGYLMVEECVKAHVERAQKHGAQLNTGETVLGWQSNGSSVQVRTDRKTYEAARLVITPGAWASELLTDLDVSFEVLRKPLLWHEVTTSVYDASNGAPTFFFETDAGEFYGFPSLDRKTVKVAQHTDGQTVTNPLDVDRDIHESDTRPMQEFLSATLPGVRLQLAQHAVCMYTITADRHFIVDKHPEYGNVAIGAGFSGHGYKFTPAVGEALADLVLEGRTDLPIEFLSIGRKALQ